MEEVDEIIIECTRSQAITSNGASVWSNSTPSIILNEGDTIQCQGGFISVQDSGDNSIEIFDKALPNQNVDTSFKISFYKTLNSQNVVTFPYHSMKYTEDPAFDQNEIFYGYSQTASTTEFEFVPLTSNNKNATAYATLSSLKNNDDGVYESVLSRLQNVDKSLSFPQGMRDEANNNARYTAMYQSTNGLWNTYTHTINASFKTGFMSPDNIANFVTSQMNDKRNIVTSNNIKEIWSASGRYFKAMTPVPIPQLNLSCPFGNKSDITTYHDYGKFVNNMSYELRNQTGFTKAYDLTITNMTRPQAIASRASPFVFQGEYSPTTAVQLQEWLYIQSMINDYSKDSNYQNYTKKGTIYSTTSSQSATDYSKPDDMVGYFAINVYQAPASNQELIGWWQDTISYDSTQGAFGKFTFGNMKIVSYNGSLTGWFQGAGTKVLSAIHLSIGTYAKNGTSDPHISPLNKYSQAQGDTLPFGAPLWIGGEVSADGDLRTNIPSSPYSWCPYNLDMITRDTNVKTSITAVGELTPTNDGNNNTYWRSEYDQKLDYQQGNRYIGMTAYNHHRWSLKNDDDVPMSDDPENDVDLQVTLKKYPNFVSKGSRLCVSDNDNIQDKMVNIDLLQTTLNVTDSLQDGNYICEDIELSRAELLTRANLYGDWFQAQEDDGLIEIDNGTFTQNGEEFFYAYIHVCAQLFTNTAPAYIKGSDNAIRDRARGLVIKVHKTTFLNRTFSGDYCCGCGVHKDDIDIYPYQIKFEGKSWIYEKVFQNLESKTYFGFQDFNAITSYNGKSVVSGDIDGLLGDIGSDDTKTRIAMGFSNGRLAWKNHTAMLCNPQIRDATDLQYMFDYNKSREIEYNDRVFLGADQPKLNYSTDNSSRFYFAQLHTPMRVQNKYFEGMNNESTNFVTTAPQPKKDLANEFSEGYTQGDTEDGLASGVLADDLSPVTITFGENEDAGNRAVFYNQHKWSLYPEGLPVFATEMTKHDKVLMASLNGGVMDRVTGDYFPHVFPVDRDFTTRFFMFAQDARRNSFSSFYKSEARYPDTTSVDIQPLIPQYSFPTCTWGALGSVQGYVENKYDAGTEMPDPEQIYDTQSGIFLEDFIVYNETNWDRSLWNAMGFEYEDVRPKPYFNCRNQRNTNTNMLSNNTLTFSHQSSPLTSNAVLINSFESMTTNLVGSKQYSQGHAMANILNAGGILNQTTSSQVVNVFKGYTGALSNASDKDNYLQEIYNQGGGSSFLNGEMIRNDVYEIDTTMEGVAYGTYAYSSNVPRKLDTPFLLVRSDIVENNFEYVNNANNPSMMNVVAMITKQYGMTDDWYFSTDTLETIFINKKKRLLTEVSIALCDSDGKNCTTLLPKSTIIFKIRRADPQPYKMAYEAEDFIWEKTMNKKQRREYNEEIDNFLNIM